MNRMLTLIAILFAVMVTGCTQIDTGNVGVVKTGGQYKAEELPPGWHFTLFSTVYEVSGKENRIELNNMQPKTSDQITIEDLDLDIYWRVNAGKASEMMTRLAGDMASNKDGDLVVGQGYVVRVAREAIYNVMATIKSSDAQAKRATIPGQVTKMLQDELDSKLEKGWFEVQSINLRGLTVDKKLEESIRAAAAVQYEIDAKKKQVELAEAEANRQRAIAQGEADASRIKAEGLRSAQGGGAEYLRLLEIQNQAEAIRKWNGSLPTTVAGGATPLIGIK